MLKSNTNGGVFVTASSAVVSSGSCHYIQLYSVSDGYATLCTGGFNQGPSDTQQCIEGACNLGSSGVNALNIE